MKAELFIPAPPISPGAVLRKFILDHDGVTQDLLASAMRVSRFSINQIINGKRSITAEMALRIAHVTSTTPEFWLNLQTQIDLYQARMRLSEEIAELPILRRPKTEEQLFVFGDQEIFEDQSDKSWVADVRRYVRKIGKSDFTLDDMYRFEEELAKAHPNNHHVREKIRQQLQILRDEGELDFIEPGVYRLR